MGYATRALLESGHARRDAGDLHYVVLLLGTMAVHYSIKGRLEEAEEMFLRSIAHNRRVGNRQSEGIAISNLAALYFRTERQKQAEDAYKNALEIQEEMNNLRFTGVHFCE